jgi:hypothetical protein
MLTAAAGRPSWWGPRTLRLARERDTSPVLTPARLTPVTFTR